MTTGELAPAPAAHYRRFIATGLAFALTLGAALGALLLATQTLPYALLGPFTPAAARSAHAYAQVFGFAALFVMGVAYHAVPRLAAAPLVAPRLATVSYWAQVGGVLLLGFAAAQATPLATALAVLGGAALVAAAAAFAWSISRTLAAGTPTGQGIEPWLRAGCAWLLLASLLTLATAAGAAALRPAIWDAALYGFAASWILGFSLRLLPAFAGMVPAPRGRGVVCAAYQVTVAAWVGATMLHAWGIAPVPLRALAGLGLATAGGVAVWRLGVFRTRAARGDDGAVGFASFVVAAYGWLLVAFVCGPAWSGIGALRGTLAPSLVLDFGRHALALGYLSQMIIGVATRIVPAISGQPLRGPAWHIAAFYLLNAAVLARGLQVVVAMDGPAAVFPWIAASGPLAFGAFVAFAVVLGLTLRGADAPAPIAPRPAARAR